MREILTGFLSVASSSVLVLNQFLQTNQPKLITNNGIETPNVTFEPDTEVYGSCGFLGDDQKFYILGGFTQRRQISVVDGCTVSRVGTLPFNLQFGSCAKIGSNTYVACFDSSSPRSLAKACYKTNDPLGEWETLPASQYQHRGIQIAATTNEILAVGGLWPSHSKTESLSGENWSWSNEADYPFTSDISEFAITTHGDDFYVFGGFSEYVNQNTIAKFSTTSRSWTQVGLMTRARNGLGVITVGDNFLVIGGQITDGQTNVAEACNLQE